MEEPSTIVFTYTPVEDPAVYENIFKPFTTHLAKCVDKKVVFYQVQSNAAEIEAMRSGRLHVAGFSTGSDRVRRQSGRRGAVRGEGNREGISGLQPDRHRSRRARRIRSSPISRAKSRAHFAVVEFRAHGAARALRAKA
jgi:hypothetical protein